MTIELDVDNIASAVKSHIDSGAEPQDVLKALTDGMNEVGRLYESHEYFLAELVLAGETMKEAFEVLKPHLTSDRTGANHPLDRAGGTKGRRHSRPQA